MPPLAIHIKAEIMQAVYAVGSEKRSVAHAAEPRKPQSGFFTSLVAAFTTPSPRHETPPPPPPVSKDSTEILETSVTLTVFTAEVNVNVDRKLSVELLRSTKKNPPQQLTYSLIYVSRVVRGLQFAET